MLQKMDMESRIKLCKKKGEEVIVRGKKYKANKSVYVLYVKPKYAKIFSELWGLI
jgi:intein-encoded DNA endonuclease-like protein